MKICLIQPNRDAYSETFIRRHIAMLSESNELDLLYCCGDWLGDKTGALLKKPNVRQRCWRSFMRRVIKVDEDFFKRQALIKRLKAKQIDVVLAEYGLMGARVWQCCRDAGVPLVVHFHGYDAYHQDILAEYGDAYLDVFGYASYVIAVSHDMQEQLVKLGCPQDKIVLKPYGVEIQGIVSERERYSAKRVLAVGRFANTKAPYLTLLAFAKVAAELEDARLTMVGDGPLKEVCEQLVRSLGLLNKVQFTGALSNAQVKEKMLYSTIFVQHSLVTEKGDSEGTPVAILEAAAHKLPVVSTRHAGIKESVLSGKSGILVDEGDLDGMADAISNLLTDANLCVKMGDAGFSHISQHYSYQLESERLLDVLAHAVKGTA